MILTFIQTKDDIQKAVKQDTSYLGVRTRDGNGDVMFEQVVYDEDYEIQFKRFFLDAQVQIIEACSAYLKGIPAGVSYTDNQNFDEDKDFIIQLAMPDDFLSHNRKVIDIRMRRYMIAHIMYSWLKDKLPQAAAVYENELSPLINGIKSALNTRLTPVRTKGKLF